MKRLFLLFVFCTYLFSSWAHDFEVNGIFYNITSSTNLTVEVTYQGDAYNTFTNEYNGNISIPSTVMNDNLEYNVASIAGSAFSGCTNLISLTIPNKVKDIGYQAFYGCTGLTNIIIPSSVINVGYGAFKGCNNIKELYIEDSIDPLNCSLCEDHFFEDSPIEYMYLGRELTNYNLNYSLAKWKRTINTVVIGKGVITIPDLIFEQCYFLSSVTIPDNVKHIGHDAFYYCDGITNIDLPDGLISIGNCAFQGCNLKSLTIPKSVTNIGRNAFNESKELESIIVESGNSSYDSRNNCNAIIETSTNTLIRGCMNTVIPNSVTSIGPTAFFACQNLTNIQIPNSIINIGSSAFALCTKLANIVIPNSVINIGEYAFQNCIFTKMEFPNSITSIGKSAFYGSSKLKDITIPTNVTNIGSNAFQNCTELSSVTSLIPAQRIVVPGNQAFENIYEYCTLYVPNGTKDFYMTTDGWNNFSKIVELPNVNTIIYMIDDEIFHTACIREGDKIVLPNPMKIGHTFSGWSEISETMPANDITVEGSFIINRYKITYIVDGVEYATDSIAYGEAIFLKDVPSKEGYTFSGWSEVPATMPAQDITITGLFDVNRYKITYTVDGVEYATDSIAYGETIVLKDEPLKDGHIFSGWSEIPATMPNHDLTIVGTFAEKVYDIQLETKDGQIIEDGSTVVIKGEMVDMMIFGQFESNLYVRNLTESNQGVYVEMKAVTGDSQICWGGSCVPIMAGNSHTTKMGVVSASSSTSLLIESLVMDTDYMNTIVTRTIEITVWTDKKPEEKVQATVTFTNNPAKLNYKTISYMIDGKLYKTQNLPAGEAVIPITPEIKEGYTFSGWSNLPDIMPDEDIVIHGNYTVNFYELTYELDGKIFQKETYSYGAKIGHPEVAQKEGYSFSGWENLPSTMPAKNIIVKGRYEKNLYLVTYMVDGVVYNTQSILFESDITLLNEPQMDGYTFSGWDCDWETMPAHDITINGYFTLNSYSLTYMLDGEIYMQESKFYGTQVKSIEVPEKEGYTFSGWGNVPAVMPASDLTLEGHYVINRHTVSYYVDGSLYTSFEMDYGTELTLLAELIKEGYTFSGWSEIPGTMPDDDVRVDGYFVANKYEIRYLLNDEVYTTDSLSYGENIDLIIEPSREGHTFSGWNEVPETMPAHDVVVTGNFVPNTYTITYILDGEVYATMQIQYGSPLYLIADPTKEGYIFSGWSEVPETMPAYDIEVKGEFANSIHFITSNRYVDVYTLQGMMVKQQVAVEELETELPSGVYIIEGKKVVIHK